MAQVDGIARLEPLDRDPETAGIIDFQRVARRGVQELDVGDRAILPERCRIARIDFQGAAGGDRGDPAHRPPPPAMAAVEAFMNTHPPLATR